GELVFFSGVRSQRAIWKSPPSDTSAGGEPSSFHDCASLLRAHAEILAENPFADAMPAIARLIPRRGEGGWWLSDSDGQTIRMARGAAVGWELLACSGGHPLNLVGLWDGFVFNPLTALTTSGLVQLNDATQPLQSE